MCVKHSQSFDIDRYRWKEETIDAKIMKILIKIFVAVAAIEISAAAPTLNSDPQPPSYYQERYEIFDSILIQMNNISSGIVLSQTKTYPQILKDYNEWLEQNKDHLAIKEIQKHKDLKENLENVIHNTESFIKDPLNCDAQSKMHSGFFNVVRLVQEIDNEDIHEIWRKHQQQHPGKEEELDEESFKEFLPKLKKQMEHFLNNLDDRGREENKDLIKWFNEFQSKNDFDSQMDTLEDVQNLFEKEMEQEKKLGKINCRFGVFLEWREKYLKIMAIALGIAIKALATTLFGNFVE
ncbi:olfactory-specific 9 [Haematobia irritans]|uniref:olfactory-specific 9 n=1 Tax=Haematobia irritans TaxID=7368 RepID=UPI003F4FF04B